MSRVNGQLGFIEPQLATLVDQPPKGEGWIHEIKHDGYRTQLVVERGAARAYTRNGFDWSERYPRVIGAAAKLPCGSAIIDGEVIVQDERGVSDFEQLQEAIKHSPHRPLFYAFDLLYLDGSDLRGLPLIERRASLKGLLRADPASRLQFSEEFIGDAAALFRACAQHELEGIVSKVTNSPYRSGRSTTWLKTKCFTEGEFTLLGVDRDRKTKAARALLAKEEAGSLVYAGTAFIALRSGVREEFNAKLEQLAAEGPSIPWLRNKDARWVRPELQVQVKHLVGARLLRHATVRNLL